MDRSHGYKKSLIFYLVLVLTLYLTSKASAGERGGFHIVAKDIDVADLEALTGEYLPSVKLNGKISLEAEIKFDTDIVNTHGNFSSPGISFRRDDSFSPIESSELKGNFKAIFGTHSQNIEGTIKTQRVEWAKASFEDILFDYILAGKKLTVKKGEGKIADGSMVLNGRMNFEGERPTFTYRLTTKGINIQKIVNQLGSNQSFSGLLFLENSLSGRMGNPTTYSGRAKVKIEGGDLGKIPIIGRLITFLPLVAIPEVFSFTTLEGDFDISGGYARTGNLKLKGPGVMILAKGEVGWNRKLNFILSFYVSSELLKGSPFTRVLGVIIDDFGNALRRVRVSGTIDKPRFVIVPLAIGDVITDSLKKSFEGLSPRGTSP